MSLIASAKAAGLNGGTTSSVDTTGATLLVAVVVCDSGLATISDSKGNTWTKLTDQESSSQNNGVIYYVANPTVGTGHTFSVNGSATASSIVAAAFDSITTTSPFDQENGSFSNSNVSSLSPGSVTPSENNELVITGLGFDSSQTVAAPSGYTLVDQNNFSAGNNYGSALAYQIQTTATATNPSWALSPSTTGTVVIATFKNSVVSATAFTLTGPSAGPNGAASSNFTVTPNGAFTGTITPDDDGAAGGTFSPTSLTWSGTSEAKTFTYSNSTGAYNIGATDDGGLSDPSDVAYEAKTTTTRVYTVDDGTEGSLTVGYTIKNLDGTKFAERSTDVTDQGGGTFSTDSAVVVPDDYEGIIQWDDDGTEYASEPLDNRPAGTGRSPFGYIS